MALNELKLILPGGKPGAIINSFIFGNHWLDIIEAREYRSRLIETAPPSILTYCTGATWFVKKLKNKNFSLPSHDIWQSSIRHDGKYNIKFKNWKNRILITISIRDKNDERTGTIEEWLTITPSQAWNIFEENYHIHKSIY
tara:strand:+ start:424 stop:846 length:423 start_codon:yes stop_codon:yes gene_type:complete